MPGNTPDPDAAKLGEELLRRGRQAKVLELFRQAEEELLNVIEHGNPKSRFIQYRKQQYQAIDIIIKRLEGQVRTSVTGQTAEDYQKGDSDTLKAIKAMNEIPFAFKFAGVNEEAVRILTEDIYVDYAKTVIGLRASAQRAVIDRAKVSDTIIRGAIQGDSFSTTTFKVLNDLKQQGFVVLKAKNGFGREMKLEPYSNLLARTNTMRAYNTGAKGRMLAAGRRYAIFPTIRPDIDGQDVCNEWEDKKYIDLLNDPLPPESTHPNCRHSPQPVSFQQLKAERPDLYQKAIAYFESVAGFTPDI